MDQLERDLREVMTDRAAVLTTFPAMPAPGTPRRSRAPRRRRRALVLAAAAIFVLGAGAAIAKVVDSLSVRPISDRYVIASGETQNGPWQLTLYRARVTEPTETTTAWCLDLDGPSVNDPGASTTERANICTRDDEPPLSEPIGATALFQDFDGARGLIYGEVSRDVASLEMTTSDGQTRALSLVPAPSETRLEESYFAALVPGGTGVELVARNENGDVLATRHIGEQRPA